MTADASTRRIGAIAGIVAMVILLVGFLLPGSPPKAGDSAKEVTDFLVDKRGSLLAGSFLIGLGTTLFVWWLATLRSFLQPPGRDDGGLARAAFAGGLVGAALNFVGAAISAATVFEVAKLGDQTLNRAMFDMTTNAFTIAGFAFALLVAAASASASRSGALPRWLIPAGFVVAAIQLVSCVQLFCESGFFAAGEAFTFIAFAAAVFWVIAVSVVMLRGERTAASN